jgi:hypothetical protein
MSDPGTFAKHRHPIVVLCDTSNEPNGSIALKCCAPGGEKHTDALELIREGVIGKDTVLWTPFGSRCLVYCDYTASGRLLGESFC